ncbi:MAG: LPS export ABC transporter periplasmic protein LptC [Prevotellaceae bacterium]|jgi:LPS export ABC transporter protein LptC|nr:LPS export ABC transporter periplasmic protein LptC [Prevotellaceae bacterium]
MNFRIIYYLLFIIHCSLFASCTNNKPQIADSVIDRAESPRLKATEITTIISDSGITRYRITTKEWYVFDKAAEPYWLFPNGLHFDRFDEHYNVDAQIDCNHATYYDKKQLWVLKDSVKCTNIEGEQFSTNLLHWSQLEERIYSDSAISIQKKTMIINGLGFESNQTLTIYRINKVTGIIPLDNDSTENE